MKTRTRFLMLDNVPTLPSLYYTWQSSWKAQVLHLQVLAGRPSILKPCPQRNPNHHNNTRQSTFSLLLSHFEHAWELLTLPLKLQKWIITLFLNFWGICSTPKLRIWIKFYVEVHLFSSVPSWNPPDVQQREENHQWTSEWDFEQDDGFFRIKICKKLLYNLIIISKNRLKVNNVRSY